MERRDASKWEGRHKNFSQAGVQLLQRLDKAREGCVGVEQEFNQIWQQLQSEMDAGRTADEDKDKSEDELKEEYRKIAERRVRLGLVLAEIGRIQEIKISEQEVQQALIREAQRYPGQERQVLEFFQKNEGAMAQLRAPIYEDKVVDHLLETVKVKEEKVSREELLSDDEE